MKILALDSSGLVASVAIAEDDKLIAEYTVQYKKTHSQTLLPMLDEVTKMIDLDIKTIDIIAIAKGPGSFTGLRIGAATAKGLALAINKPIIGIPTIEGLAYQLYGAEQIICPIMDARRAQVYTGLYQFRQQQEGKSYLSRFALEVIREQCTLQIEEIIEDINQRNQEVIFTGDGIPVFRDTIAESIHVPYIFAPLHRNRQSAAAIAALAFEYHKAGSITIASEFHPEYLRMSQAERERKEKLSIHADSERNV